LIKLCEWLDIDILEGATASDHVHMYLSVPPKNSPAHVMKVLKGKNSEYLRREFPDLGKKFWGLHIWARGYFVSMVRIDRDVIKRYVKEHQEDQIREDQLKLWKESSE
jgi:putative transposase